MELKNFNRRRFLQSTAATGAALVLGFKMPVVFAKDGQPQDPDDINAWLRIADDGTITIMVPSAELGQGVYTSAPMLIAEELECDWNMVRAEQSPTSPVYNNRMFKVQATASSTSSRWSFDPLRHIGATAREMLRQAAANEWGVPLSECRAKNSTITHTGSKRSLSYAALAKAASVLPRPAQVTLKDKADWTLIGKPIQRLDIPLKTSGTAIFGVDVKVPDMLLGTVAACPMLGGTLAALDDKPALNTPGVTHVIPLDNAVVVLGDSYWTAAQGLAQLKPQWAPPEGPLLQTAALMDTYRQAAAKTDTVALMRGEPDALLQQGAATLSAEYEVPYLAHATMEPMNATAHVHQDSAEIWGPTQVPGEIAGRLAPVLGIAEDRITVHSTFVGGGFGRREETVVFEQAALASQKSGRPVKLIWSREEDMRHDFYRPAAAARFAAVLDDQGQVQALESRLACSSIYIRNFPSRVKDGVDPKSVEGVVDVPYHLPQFAVRYAMVNTHIPCGFWRGVGYTQNSFFFESFVDEMAHAAQQDPLAFRLAMLQDKPRHAKLLRALGDMAGWGKAPDGHFQGVALTEAWGSICGTIIELSVKDKTVTIHRVVCGVDSGHVINPATVERQLEGASIWALASVFNSEITITDGKIDQANFDTYPIIHLSQTPPIETLLMPSGDKIGGVGESGVPPFTPALTNAIFAATGDRIRTLPARKQGYKLS